MPRPASGSIESHQWKDGRTISWWLRVRANGARHRIDLGTNHEGWSHERAQVELDRVRREIERGTWEPPETRRSPALLGEDETLHVTISRWWQSKERDLSPNGRANYRWQVDHILAGLAAEPTAGLDARRIDAFRDGLLEQGLSATSANMIVARLAQILDEAVEYGLREDNPARGRRRRLKQRTPRRNFLEPDQVVDLLDVAGEWEAEVPEHQRYGRRTVLATLVLAGPRVGELVAADRADLDLHGGRLRVGESKTEAGQRDIELTAFLLDELRPHLASVYAPQGSRKRFGIPLYPTRRGGRLNPSNLRNRLLAETVRRANVRRLERGQQLLPERVTPHTLRRTFASLALTAGRDPRWVMGQLGHTDARLTLNVYAQVMQRQRVDRELVWALMRFDDEREVSDGGALDRRALVR